MGWCIRGREGPESLGAPAAVLQGLQMDGARLQPGGHLRLPAADPGVCGVGHGAARAGRPGVHPLEGLGRPQLHLALHRRSGRI